MSQPLFEDNRKNLRNIWFCDRESRILTELAKEERASRANSRVSPSAGALDTCGGI
jgi:hypothetical protein